MVCLFILTLSQKIEPVAEFDPKYTQFAITENYTYAKSAESVDRFSLAGNLVQKDVLPPGTIYAGKNHCISILSAHDMMQVDYVYDDPKKEPRTIYKNSLIQSYSNSTFVGFYMGSPFWADESKTHSPTNKFPNGYQGPLFKVGTNLAYALYEEDQWNTYGINFQPIPNFCITAVSPNEKYILGNQNDIEFPVVRDRSGEHLLRPVLITDKMTSVLEAGGHPARGYLVDNSGAVFGLVNPLKGSAFAAMWKNGEYIVLDDFLAIPKGFHANTVLARSDNGLTAIQIWNEEDSRIRKTLLFYIP